LQNFYKNGPTSVKSNQEQFFRAAGSPIVQLSQEYENGLSVDEMAPLNNIDHP